MDKRLERPGIIKAPCDKHYDDAIDYGHGPTPKLGNPGNGCPYCEIELLWACVRAADRLHSDTLYRWAPEAKDHYMRQRAALSADAGQTK